MKRFLVALGSLALALVIVLGLQVARRVVRTRQAQARVKASIERFEAIYVARQLSLGAPIEDPGLLRVALDEETARWFFPSNGNGLYGYDPQALSVPLFLVEPPFLDFDEHPRGGFTVATNREGLREDADVEVPKRDLRVIVAGDSHTYGLCANDESFSNLLEPMLEGLLEGRDVDVLNGGAGATYFPNYLGTFERLSRCEPDLLVLVAYGGNDFSATCAFERYLRGRSMPAIGPHPNRKQQLPRGAADQETSQVNYFRNNPDDLPRAAPAAAAWTLEAARLAERLGAGFLAVYLPPPTRGQPQLHGQIVARAAEVLELEPGALELSDRLADEWLGLLAEAGVRTLDLRPAIRAADERLYWVKDLHLDVDGHRRVAQALLPVVAELLEPEGLAQGGAPLDPDQTPENR